jgi:putative transposase
MKNQGEKDIRRGRSCVFALPARLVFTTKRRRKALDGNAIRRLREVFDVVCRKFEVELAEMNGEEDHVHLLVNFPPSVSISSLVNSLKGVSSRILRKERPEMRYSNAQRHHLWTPSYFAGSCGGAPLSIVKQYVEQQNTPR